jgi:hypothetical protein
MPSFPERRGPDRRRQPRGGRRADDREGFAPLVMLVGDEPAVVDRSEAILAKLRFAVATSSSVDHALRVLPDLKPDLVVAAQADEARLRGGTPTHVPLVVMNPDMQDDPEALIEEIRRALRAAR